MVTDAQRIAFLLMCLPFVCLFVLSTGKGVEQVRLSNHYGATTAQGSASRCFL